MPEVLDPPTTTPQPDTNNTKRYRPPAIDKTVVETAKGLYLQGTSLRAIAQQLNLNPTTVRYWSFKQRWPELVGKVKQLTQLTEDKKSVGVFIPTQSEQSARVRNVLGAVVERQAAALAASTPSIQDLLNKPERQGHAAALKTIADAASVVFDWDSQHTPGIVLVGEVERMIEANETPIDVAGSVEQIPEQADTTTGSVPE